MVRNKNKSKKSEPEQKKADDILKKNSRHIVIPNELKKQFPRVTLSLDTILTKSDVERLIRILSSPDKKDQ
ncbi:MAG: hypothetical protein HQL69_00230 [Magnetococcales bacterium]|nr:hypothetical protein [Magnetococcales bacterium]